MYTSRIVNFTELQLDEQNPRFTTSSGHSVTEIKIMEYLIKSEFVVDLAESIQNFGGLVPGERLLVMKEKNNKYTVLEGNRRTAAISLLLNPNKYLNSLSINSRESRRINKFITSVSDKLKNQLSHFEVDTVVNRDDAIYSLAERHIEGIRTWSQVSKMYFYQQHLDSGKDIYEIKKYSPESTRTIADFLRKYSFFRFVLNAYKNRYPNGKFSKTEFETTIPTELIIQRIFNSLKESLRIDFNTNNYQMLLKKYTKDQYELLSRIFADISYLYWDLRLINTRNLNTVQDFQDVFFNSSHAQSSEDSIAIGKLITELETSLQNNIQEQKEFDLDDIDNKDEHEQPEPDDIDNKDEHEQPEPDDIDNKGNDSGGRLRDPKTYKYLTTAYPVKKKYKDNPRINALKIELGSLEYKEFNLSSMFLIRSLLETYTHEYIDFFANLSHDNPLRMKSIQKQRKDRKSTLLDLIRNNIHDHLKHTLNDYAETYGVIETTLSTNNNTALTQIINHYIHTTISFPEKREVLDAWSKAVIIINTMDNILYEHINAGQIEKSVIL